MTEVEEGSTNVYADLGRLDAGAMLIKAQLAAKIGAVVAHHGLTQLEAAEVVGMAQSDFAGLLRGRFRVISEAKMLDCLARLGQDVRIVVGPARQGSAGRVEVVSG